MSNPHEDLHPYEIYAIEYIIENGFVSDKTLSAETIAMLKAHDIIQEAGFINNAVLYNLSINGTKIARALGYLGARKHHG